MNKITNISYNTAKWHLDWTYENKGVYTIPGCYEYAIKLWTYLVEQTSLGKTRFILSDVHKLLERPE